MIARTIGFLGLLASIMALSSLIYGAFQEPLGPYMQGIMGGVMEIYRTMRDALFAGLGTVFSGLINFIGRWLTWLPPVPWFKLVPLAADAITLYVLGAATAFKASMTYLLKEHSRFDSAIYFGSITAAVFWPLASIRAILGACNARERFERLYDEVHEITGPHPDGPENREMLVGWNTENAHRLSRNYLIAYASVLLGSALFFLLVYAENRIGL